MQTFPTLQNIILLRACAALMVCFFHFTCGNIDYLPFENTLAFVALFGRYGVDIFFVVSGFVIPYSLAKRKHQISDFFSFLKRRFWRIEVPYLTSLLLALLVGFAVAVYKKEAYQLNFVQISLHFFYLNSFSGYDWLVPVYWTLAIEFQYYVWVGFIFPCLHSARRQARWGIWIAWGLLAYLLPSDKFFFQYGGLFGLGIVLFQYALKRVSRLEFWTLLSFFLVWISIQISPISAFFGLCACLFILLEIKKMHIPFFWLGRQVQIPFLWVGKISYSLYLTHIIVAGKFIGFVEQKTALIWVRMSAVFIALLFAILVATLFYYLVERRFFAKNEGT